MENFQTLLMELAESGMLESAVRDAEETMKRKKILEQHPYKIWQGTDGRWYTKVKSEDKLKI